MDIKRVGVIGAGTMGNGIAHVFARGRLFGGVVRCGAAVSGSRDGGDQEEPGSGGGEGQDFTAEDKAAALERIEPVTERARLGVCDFIVEAATEKFEIKAEIFRDLDRVARPEVILASNTSSISITKLGALTKRPDQVIGMHFFNPVPVMKLVEVIRGLATSRGDLF